jgi:hypothetical protein
MAIGVTIETRHAQAGPIGAPVLGCIELLLRKLRQQESQALQLLRVDNAIEDLVVVVDRDQPTLGYITQIRARGQVDRWSRVR